MRKAKPGWCGGVAAAVSDGDEGDEVVGVHGDQAPGSVLGQRPFGSAPQPPAHELGALSARLAGRLVCGNQHHGVAAFEVHTHLSCPMPNCLIWVGRDQRPEQLSRQPLFRLRDRPLTEESEREGHGRCLHSHQLDLLQGAGLEYDEEPEHLLAAGYGHPDAVHRTAAPGDIERPFFGPHPLQRRPQVGSVGQLIVGRPARPTGLGEIPGYGQEVEELILDQHRTAQCLRQPAGQRLQVTTLQYRSRHVIVDVSDLQKLAIELGQPLSMALLALIQVGILQGDSSLASQCLQQIQVSRAEVTRRREVVDNDDSPAALNRLDGRRHH